jgi:hypothetical protein
MGSYETLSPRNWRAEVVVVQSRSWLRVGAGTFLVVTLYVLVRPEGASVEGPLSIVGLFAWFGLALVALGWFGSEIQGFNERRRR